MQAHEFWQNVVAASDAVEPPYLERFPARLPDGRVLFLPIRTLAGTDFGIASLILNQASFTVEATLADMLADRLKSAAPDIVVGLPTLGLSLARAVAERLGHRRYVPLGTSRKFWYDDELSVPMRSITSPDSQKRLYFDPRMLPLLDGARTALIDDVISSGTSISAGLDLLRVAGHSPVAIGAAMLQTERWIEVVEARHPGMAALIQGVIETPLLHQKDDGWSPVSNEV